MVDHLAPDFDNPPGRRPASAMYVLERTTTPAQADVSIITPYYNTDEVFLETFQSLKAQSLQNWEWIVVDDGSTEPNSISQLKEVASRDHRVKLVRQENAGPSAARNAGFELSRGRYIALIDSDDMIEPTYLEKCVWFLESNPEFAFCNSFSVIFGNQCFLHATGFGTGKQHVLNNSGPPISVIRRAAYSDAGGFDASIRFGHEDWDFWLAMAKAGHWGYTLKEYLQWYRKRSNSRFEQIMSAGTTNAEFEALMRSKYAGLEQHFPEPVRRTPTPYETVRDGAPIANRLNGELQGRHLMLVIPWMVTGGADRVNLDLIEGLASRGHQITIVATLPADHRWEHQFARFTPDIFVLPNILSESDYPRFLAYLINSRSIDTVLITGSTIGYQMLPYMRANSSNVAFLDMCHVEEENWLNGGHPRFGVGYQELLDVNIVTTSHLGRWMQDRGADGRRIELMHTGIRTTSAADVPDLKSSVVAEWGLKPDVPVIVFAGRLCDQKRPLLLIEILAALKSQGAEFQALIIGDGELRGQVEELVAQRALQNHVRLLGSLPHQKWLDLLVVSDILLMPSQYEGISIALLEAMAAGVVPVVAYVGGQGEIVEPSAGDLIAQGPHELDAYAQAVHAMLVNPDVRMARAARCRTLAASKFSWSTMIDRFEQLMDRAHAFRLDAPRNPVSPGVGRELAAMALENKRLGDAVHWLWNSSNGGAATSPEAQAVARFAIALSQTRIGVWLLGNRVIKAVARRVLAKIHR